jgi:aldose 1-epimerase
METYILPRGNGFVREIDEVSIGLYTIHSPDKSCNCSVTNYGARIVSLIVPDVHSEPVDVVLGYSSLEGYLQQPEEYMGAAVGRCANRIAAGLFVLDGNTCILPVNNGVNTLHGGIKGLHARVWQVKNVKDHEIILSYHSADGEEGFPGNLDIELTYRWTDNTTLLISYRATSDKATLVNLSNHSYFNLSGEGATTILDHELQLMADSITPVNAMLIPTGSLQPVSKTAFDFRSPYRIGERINNPDEQLKYGKGYDHNYVLRKANPAVQLCSPVTGIRMSISTDQPGMQFYSGNFLDGSRIGKSGKPYLHRSAVALEPQGFPDAIHHPSFPSVVLKPGEVYHADSSYSFSTS